MIEKNVFILLGLLLSSIPSFAQKNEVKIDTVHIPVYYVRFFDGNPSLLKGVIFDIYSRSVVIPENIVNREQVPLLYQDRKKNKFNGIFLTTEDDLVAHFGVITLKLNKVITDFLNKVNNPAIPTNFISYKEIPNSIDRIFTFYDGYLLDAVWIKYTIIQFTPNEDGWHESYMDQVAGADGKTFNYYLLHKVNSSKLLD